MMNNIVDNIEQCGQHNIVQGCFHQPRTGCAFLRVYNVNVLILANSYLTLREYTKIKYSLFPTININQFKIK